MGFSWVVGREVSAQPPWSMAMSTNTEPFFMAFSMVRLISLGARAPGTSTAPISRSILGSISSRFCSFEYNVCALPCRLMSR